MSSQELPTIKDSHTEGYAVSIALAVVKKAKLTEKQLETFMTGKHVLDLGPLGVAISGSDLATFLQKNNRSLHPPYREVL